MHGVPSRLLLLLLRYYVHLFYSVCSIFQCMFCLPLSHLSPSHLFHELYKVSVAVCHCFLHFRHDLSIDRFHVYLSVYFNEFRSDETLKTPWGKSDILDCHMGVMWLHAARWLVASRGLIIFSVKILRYAPIFAIIGLCSDQIWNKLYWIFFIHFR